MAKKSAQKKLEREKMKKNKPNLQTRSVFWFVGEAIHKIRGISQYGDLGGSLGLRRGLKLHSRGQNHHKRGKIEKKLKESINKLRFLADSTLKL